jgi:hypothetical protein
VADSVARLSLLHKQRSRSMLQRTSPLSTRDGFRYTRRS